MINIMSDLVWTVSVSTSPCCGGHPQGLPGPGEDGGGCPRPLSPCPPHPASLTRVPCSG